MGHPKRQRKKYKKPRHTYENLEEEKRISKMFGLRRKKELWKAENIIREYRRRARDLQANPDKEKEKELIGKLVDIGILEKGNELEDILELTVEDVLKRRIQSIVHKKGFAKTPKQARQIIAHEQIIIGNRKVKWPSYIVKKSEENDIKSIIKLGGNNGN